MYEQTYQTNYRIKTGLEEKNDNICKLTRPRDRDVGPREFLLHFRALGAIKREKTCFYKKSTFIIKKSGVTA